MFESPSLIKRIAIGKLVGLIIGLIGVTALYFLAPSASALLYWGVVLWYATLGAIVGVFGVFTEHPVLKFSMPWWLRASIIGGWMNFVLTFFAYESFQLLMVDIIGDAGMSISPFWFTLEGVIVGLLVGFFATRYGGEGENLPVSAK
ncbi:MAG: hypothetical protein V7727_15840 [Sneathiella sp.]